MLIPSGQRPAVINSVAAILALSVGVVFLFAPAEMDPTWSGLSDVAFLVVGTVVAAACLASLRRLPPEERPAWATVAGGVTIVVLANAIWTWYRIRGEDPIYPGPADAAYLLGYLTMFIGILGLPSRRSLRSERLRWIADAIIASVGAAALAWGLSLGAAVSAATSTGTFMARAIAVAFPLVDVLNLTGLMVLLIRPTRYRFDRRAAFLGIGLAAVVVGDGLYFHQVGQGVYWSGNSINFYWFLWHASVAVAFGLAHAPGPSSDDGKRRSGVINAAVFLPTAALVAFHALEHPLSEGSEVFEIGVSISAVLLVIRQTLAMREIRQVVERGRDDLISSISHELRTPLAAVHGFTGILAAEEFADPLHREMIGLAHAQTGHLTRIISDLVSLGRGSLEATALRLEPVSVPALVDDAVRMVCGGVEVEVEVPSDLVVVCDRTRITQILANYLTNALRYGGGRLACVAEADDRYVTVEVHDNGVGVPLLYQDRIWDRFDRGAHHLDGLVQGSGLGLAVARALATAHGGSVDYRRSPRLGGACFSVRIPLSRNQPDHPSESVAVAQVEPAM